MTFISTGSPCFTFQTFGITYFIPLYRESWGRQLLKKDYSRK